MKNEAQVFVEFLDRVAGVTSLAADEVIKKSGNVRGFTQEDYALFVAQNANKALCRLTWVLVITSGISILLSVFQIWLTIKY